VTLCEERALKTRKRSSVRKELFHPREGKRWSYFHETRAKRIRDLKRGHASKKPRLEKKCLFLDRQSFGGVLKDLFSGLLEEASESQDSLLSLREGNSAGGQAIERTSVRKGTGQTG